MGQFLKFQQVFFPIKLGENIQPYWEDWLIPYLGVAYAIGLNFWWLVLGAVLGGLGRSFYSGNNDAYLYDSLSKSDKKEELAKFMGIIGSAEQ